MDLGPTGPWSQDIGGQDKTSGLKGGILASCPFAAYVRVVGGQVRDEYDYICKISTYDLACFPYCEQLLGDW